MALANGRRQMRWRPADGLAGGVFWTNGLTAGLTADGLTADGLTAGGLGANGLTVDGVGGGGLAGGGVGGLVVGVAEGSAWGYSVSDQALQLGEIRETVGFAVPEGFVVEADFEYSACSGDQSHLPQVSGEGREQFLRQPGGSEQPTALGAVFDL